MKKPEIMIVEDNVIIQTELKFTLEEIGYRVRATASSALEAIEKAEKVHPDLILMDIQIKGDKDGIEAAMVIKERLNIPVIFTTAFSDDEKVNRAKLSIPYGYLIKPIQERDLKITIEMALYTSKIEAERSKAMEERDRVIKELQEALDNIKKLKGLLPICANCKKIRDDKGYWNQLESYIEQHSEALFSHGVCPECAEILYKDSKWYKKLKKDDKSS